MLFLLKKHISPLLLPLPFSMLLLLIGVALLWIPRRERAGKIVVTLALALLALFSSTPVSHALLGRLERQYPANPTAPARWVVVLSGGYSDDTRLPSTDRLSRDTLARLTEGIRLLKSRPGARLLVSGGSALGQQRGVALCMAEAAREMGVAPSRIVVESKTRDTEEQAIAVRKIVGKESFLLVTSAAHLPRSMALFRGQGLHPIPAPADHRIKPEECTLLLHYFYPGVDNLSYSTNAVYEYLGLAWARLRGRS